MGKDTIEAFELGRQLDLVGARHDHGSNPRVNVLAANDLQLRDAMKHEARRLERGHIVRRADAGNRLRAAVLAKATA